MQLAGQPWSGLLQETITRTREPFSLIKEQVFDELISQFAVLPGTYMAFSTFK